MPAVVDTDRIVLRREGRDAHRRRAAPAVGHARRYRPGGGRLNPSLEFETVVTNTGDSPVAFELAVEWNVNLMGGGHNPAAYYETEAGGRTAHDIAGSAEPGARIAFGNDTEGVRVDATTEPAAALVWYPVETISNSEGGFERVYQGSSMLFRWPVSLAPGPRAGRSRSASKCAVDRLHGGRGGVGPRPSIPGRASPLEPPTSGVCRSAPPPLPSNR